MKKLILHTSALLTICSVVVACGSGNNNVTSNHYAFISNAGNNAVGNISICTLSESGGITNCRESSIGITDSFSPSSIAINNGLAYINDTNSTTLYTCNLVESTLSNCTTSSPSGYITTSFGGISINNGYLYASSGTTIPESAVYCRITTDNASPMTCNTISSIPSGLSGTFSFNQSFAYIADYDHSGIQQCIIGVNGELTNCGNTISSSVLAGPVDIITSNGFAYVADSVMQNISTFSIDASGNFTFVESSPINSIASNGNINNMAIFNNTLYIPNNTTNNGIPNNSITKCSLKNNVVNNCTYYTDSTFNIPQSITIK